MRRRLGTGVRWAGIIWLWAALAFVLFGYVTILVFRGLPRLLETVNPYNFANTLAVALTFAPGVGLVLLGDRLRR